MRAGRPWPRQAGFTYLWALAAVAVLGVALAAVGASWSADIRRERERELLRIGELYARAIAAYHRVSPGSERRFPESLEALLLDTRFVGTQRHLRQPYPDPLDPERPWGVIRDARGAIRGVYSTSDEQPLQRVPIDLGGMTLSAARRYSDWQFIAKVEP